MTPVTISRPRERLAALAVAAGFVIFRAFVFLRWEQSYFDADQAIVALMAKHLAEGRAFPLFFYGQQYLLGVESWIVSPFFLLFGTSVFTLKLPLLLMNLAAAAMLILGLERYAGVRPAVGVLACLFFLASPPGPASRLVQANGCNIEPFLYVVALWMLRDRPVAFGLTAGVGCRSRLRRLVMEADFRRNCGHGTIRTRLEDPTLPYAWLARVGRLAIIPILAGKVIDSWRDCVRCGAHYGVRGYELPAAMAISVFLHFLEIPGMLQAYRGGGLSSSHFR